LVPNLCGDYSNQAELTGMSVIYGTSILSDDPNTAAVTDATVVTIENCVEICDDNIDNDGDGYIDNFDPDCPGYAPFLCDYKLYQTLLNSGDFVLYEVNTDPVSFDSLYNLNTNGVISDINSLAYNPVDGFIYGIGVGAGPYLYRINNLGEVDNLGLVTGLSGNVWSGGMGSNGEYYVTGSAEILYQVDINTLVATNIGNTGFSMADIAVNPVDGQIYGWRHLGGPLYKFDPTDGSSTSIGSSNNRWDKFGSFYFNAQGDIIAYGGDKNIPATDQETLVRIDPATGVVTVLGTGPETTANDGCSCAYGIELTKAAAPTTVNAGDVFTYTFTVFNRTGAALTDITFNDVLTDGFLWNTEPENVTGLTLGATS
ncbi:MAG: DUF11 domain-containing protein, partial [Oceanicoccus sp.]|uniref:DUF6923 family protein n=1 Tax=Oceanicoccus sp. TaxID=2691044 RepID=UPI00261B1F40